jgi:hypothetical protein
LSNAFLVTRLVADTLEASCRFKRVASKPIFLFEKVIFLKGQDCEKEIDIDMALTGHFHYIVRHGDIDAFSHGKLVVPKEVIQAAIREQILTLNTALHAPACALARTLKSASTFLQHTQLQVRKVRISKDTVVRAPDH